MVSAGSRTGYSSKRLRRGVWTTLLLARRLVERGVRFLEVGHNLNFLNGAGWDVHNQGIEKQHELIREMDQALSALMIDLEAKKLLDKTLIVITTEFVAHRI